MRRLSRTLNTLAAVVTAGVTVAAVVLAGLVAVAGGARPAVAADARHDLGAGRFYVAHRPPGAAVAMVVVLHSLSHDWREGVAQGWSALADARGFLAVYPDGDGGWNAGLCCAPANDPVRQPLTLGRVGLRDDVGFLERVIADARARYRTRYTYLAGYSSGGMMAERLLAERPWLAGRLAVWAAAPEMPTPGAWLGRAWLGHGAADTTVPWQGGTVTLAGRRVLIRPGQATRAWLIGGRFEAHVFQGLGHSPPAWWPAQAWASFAVR
jgi:poly(3-hydroxybutyrate) depolymerase